MRIAGSLHARLSLIHRLLMFVVDLLAVLEDLGTGLAILIQSFLAEFVEEGPFGHNVRVFLFGVEDYVEEGD